jgi:hypothetical protein
MELLASSYDQSRFLSAADVPREKKFRIKEATEEVIGKDPEKKLIVWFTNHKKGLVLNKTNNRTIRGAFGDPIKGWINKIIIIFPTYTDFRGNLVPALRVRIPPPKQEAMTAAPPQQPTAPAAAAPPPQRVAAVAAVAPPPQQAVTAAPAATTPPKPAPSGNGAPAAPQSAVTAAVDPELEDDPMKPLAEEIDDEIAF